MDHVKCSGWGVLGVIGPHNLIASKWVKLGQNESAIEFVCSTCFAIFPLGEIRQFSELSKATEIKNVNGTPDNITFLREEFINDPS